MRGIEDLKKAILAEKLKQNDELQKYGKDAYGDYYTGFISAMSIVEGYVAEMELMNRSYKCRHCKYISDLPSTGSWHRCNCEDRPFRTSHSHLVYKWNHACRFFEKRENADGV